MGGSWRHRPRKKEQISFASSNRRWIFFFRESLLRLLVRGDGAKIYEESWCSTFRTKISRVKSASFHSICKNHFSTRSNISVAESLFHSVWEKQSLTIKFSPMTSCSARDKCFCCYNVLRVGGTRHEAARSKSDGDRFKWMTMERSRCDCE